MESITKEFMNFVDGTPNAFYSVKNIKEILTENGYTELKESEEWKLEKDGKYFVIRNDSALIAFQMASGKNIGFNITESHSDSPSFRIKPNPESKSKHYLRLNIEKYGGMINYSWFDRPLSLAGRLITRKNGIFKKELVNIDKDLLVIPSQAIHINREVNKEFNPKYQKDMLPVMSLQSDLKLIDVLIESLKAKGITVDEIIDYDLFVYNRDKSKVIGLNDQFILSPRLDDLASLYPALKGFIDSKNENTINMFCAFNNEEIGSLTIGGADSTFLLDTMSRIAEYLGINIHTAIRNSFGISADNAHAIHPSATEKSDPTNIVEINKGVAIKHHINYSTDALSSSIFKGICELAKVPYQDYAHNSDLLCGSTLGPISQRHVGIDTVDIGIPQLAMHSSVETMGSKDLLYMYKSLLEFYNTTIVRDGEQIKLLQK